MNQFRKSVVCCLILACAGVTQAADETTPVSFFKQIRPILQEHCQGCHQPAKPQGGLVLTSFAGMQKGGISGEAGVVAGSPDDSLLVDQITPLGTEPPLMPKDAPPLKAEQIELIRRWVAEGAQNDTPEMVESAIDADHPPVYAAAPVVTSVEYSPDDTLLAVSGYHEVLLHHADGSGLVARLVGLSERIESAVFSPDGTMLAVTGGSPGRFGELQVWNVAERKLLLSKIVTFDTIYGASWSSDNQRICFGCGDNTVRVVEAATGKQVLYQGAHSDWVLDTAFSTDNSHVVSVSRDMSMKLTEVATERFVDNVTSITPGALKGGLMTVDRHPVRDELLIGGADGEPKIYQMYRTQDRQIGDDFNRVKRFAGAALPGRIFAAEYSPDGQGEVRAYQESDGAQVSRFNTDHGAVYCLAVRANGQEAAVAGFDGTVRIYKIADGSLIKAFVPMEVVPIAVATATGQ